MKKKYKISLLLIIIVILLLIGLTGYFLFTKNKEKETIVNVVDKIENFNYTLDDRDTKLMHENFEELSKILDKEEINYEEYAKCLAKLFIIDLFTIDNKNNKYDVGGVEYILESDQANFRINIENSLYDGIEVKENRKQNLPIVDKIEIVDLKEIKYEYDKKEYEAYEINLTWDYKKDYEYDKKNFSQNKSL